MSRVKSSKKEAIAASPFAAIIGRSRLILSCQVRTNLAPTSRRMTPLLLQKERVPFGPLCRL
jgi:hypothetical protein